VPIFSSRAFPRNNIVNEIIMARDGLEALDYLFATGPHAGRDMTHAPAVILNSSREEQDLIEGYRLGANSYVRMPVDFAQFLDATRQLWSYWLVLNEAPPVVRA
jgi:two-component system response regulator